MTIKLYDLVGRDPSRPFSPHCWKTRMCLAHKGLDFEVVPVGFTQVAGIEDGSSRKVPVIRHGDKVIEDSFDIALYLRDTYPDRGKRLFKGDGSVALSRFVETWCQTQLHGWIAKWSLVDIHDMLGPDDQAFFRQTREERFGKSLEEVVSGREDTVPQLENILMPIRLMLKKQDFLGGDYPLFADYIPFGALQWLRVVSGLHMMDPNDPVMQWFERLLDMHDGAGRTVPEAAA